jgi:DNA-binding LytR/AlgR family response regulator
MSLQKYPCLVVDDEPIARQIVRTYIEQMSLLKPAGECKNAFEALEKLRSNPDIAIIFLDINMPNLSGISLVKSIPKLPQVIFTTAYHEFAVESYELDAVDYLLKPFSFERFAKGVFKAIDRLEKKTATTATKPEPESVTPIFIKSDGKSYRVALSDILFCEAMKNYTKVYLKNGDRLLPLVPLSKMETDLLEIGADLLRVHRSYIVARQHISAIEGNQLLIADHKIPVGDQFRESFFKEIGLK